VPAVIGLYSVAEAPPQTRIRTLFEEGFGVVGGALGTQLGMYAGIGLVTVLGLGPMGLFIAVFLCATSGGIIGNEIFKWGSKKFYDVSDGYSDRIYHSFEDVFGAR
jgi:hypothetical protein